MNNSHDAVAQPTAGQTANDSPQTQAYVHIYPDQRQAWIVVAAMAATMCILFGTTISSFGVFIPALTQTFASTNEQTANVATAFMVAMTLAMPLAGWLLDRIGPRTVMSAGALLMGAGYLMASVSHDINTVTLAMALSGIGVGASTYIPAIALVMRWVELKRQGLALGVLLSGGSIGTMIFPILLTYMTELHGWRFAMQAIAAITLLLCVPLLLRLARLPSKPLAGAYGQHSTQQLAGVSILKALRLPRYWLWIALQVLMSFSTLGIVVNMIPYLVSVGYSQQEAATLFALKSAVGLGGSFLFGVLSSRWNIKPILMIGMAIGGFSIFTLLLANDPTFGFSAVLFFTIAWGATFNLVNQLSPILMEETVGQRNFGALLGIGNLIGGLAGAFSPKLVGYLLDTSGTYSLALILCAACMLAAIVPIALQRTRLAVSAKVSPKSA